uniref:C-type lectin domain-containing protein n=1 Tax=Cyprinodon variegatus TaxID=28743 RepID=A0A3Q2FYH7_CYPVA
MDRSILVKLLLFAAFLASHSQCREGWREYEDKCYFFSNDTKSWEEANAYLKPTSKSVLSSLFICVWEWTESVFVYTDGSAADLLPWALGQPDNWENNEDCVHLTGMTHPDPGKLNDEKCTATKEFVLKPASHCPGCKHCIPNLAIFFFTEIKKKKL